MPTAAILVLLAVLYLTGGPDSIFHNLFVVVLALSAVTHVWVRLVVDVGLVVVGNVALLALGGATPEQWQTLVVDLVVWLLVAGVVRLAARRFREAAAIANRSRSAINLLEDAVVVVDAATFEVQYANRAADRLAAAVGVASAVGHRPWQVGPWPDEEQLRTVAREQSEEPAQLTLHDHERVLEVTAEPVAWEGDAAIVLLSRDITARHEAERTLEEREQRFRALAEDAAGVVYRIRVQPEVEVEYVSPQIQDVLGFEPAEFYVDPGLIVRRARPQHRVALNVSVDGHAYGEQGVQTYSIRHADGHWLWLEDHHTPEHDRNGELVAIQGIVFDVSAKWETEAALGEAQRKHAVATETLHRTARVERTFLQSISHEIRTPMTSALGFARMLHTRRDALSDEQQDSLLERLVANIERIEELVGQFLEFDRYARGDTEIERSLERLDEVAAEVAAGVDLEGRVLRTRLELVMAMVDRRRVAQVIEGLLLNAVRHTPSEVTVELVVTSEEGFARIIVQDDGPGVAPEVADHVFEPFTQGPASQDAANPGVGLGLAMVRVSARLHGGDARLEPVEPHGARFVVEFPLDDDPRPPQPQPT